MTLHKGFNTVFLGLILFASGCATPEVHLWPPSPGTPTKEIFVSLDTWHAMIAFPQEDVLQQGTPLSKPPVFEEWGYAEREWYLEGEQGLSGVIRAMFWPTEGVVEVAESDQVWADRTPQPPSDLFIFHLSQEGYQRLRTHLRSTIVSSTPIITLGRSRFYPAIRSYHLFHHCHHYVARALQEAGLPISTSGASSRTSLAMQLEEAEKLTDEEKE